MLEKIKENIFVVIIAVLILCSIGFYIYSDSQYKVSSVSSGGKDIIATATGTKISADDLYKDKVSGDTLYWQYRSAVIDESQKDTKEVTKEAKKMAKNIESYYRRQNSGDETDSALKKELATYGFTGKNAALDYATVVKKEVILNKKYINNNYEKLSTKVLQKNPKSVYLIALEQSSNPVEKNTKKYVDDKIAKNGFVDTAKDYASITYSLNLTDDTGLYGYTDTDDESNTFSSDSSKIPGEVAKKVKKLKKGQMTGWVTVTDSNNATYYVKAYVSSTNLKSMLNSSNDRVDEKTITAFVNANSTLNSDILDHYAKKLKITFKDKKTEKKLNEYLKEMRKNGEEMGGQN